MQVVPLQTLTKVKAQAALPSPGSHVEESTCWKRTFGFFVVKKPALSDRVGDVWVCQRIPFSLSGGGKKSCRVSVLMN